MMMKKYLLILLILGTLACQDDETLFDITIPTENISFKPMPGGAIMYYKLPANSDIFSIQVSYIDAIGQELVSTGSYACDSLELVGFNEARQGVPANVTLLNHKHEKSRNIAVQFDTEDSAPYAFFNKAEVKPHWGGFSLSYESPEIASGLAHVFYVGENPITQETDTLLLKSLSIAKGRDTLFFPLQQENAFNTVVVRTEDVRGYRVKQQIWNNIEAYQSEKVAAQDIELLDPENLILEYDQYKVGTQYLFDGDLNGINCLTGHNSFQYHTFLAGPNAIGAPFILDLKKQVVPAYLRFYAILNTVPRWPRRNTSGSGIMGTIWNAWYLTKLPNEVSIYASNDKDDENSWERIGYFHQGKRSPLENRWCRRTRDPIYKINSMDELLEAEPCYMTVEFPAREITYRYLKFVIEDTFYNTGRFPDKEDQNVGKYFTLNELEIYVKK